LEYQPSGEVTGVLARLAESPRLGIVIAEHLVWSPRDGTIGRPYLRAVRALAGTHADIVILSERPPAVVEMLQRSIRFVSWISAGGSVPPWMADSIRVRFSGVPLIVIRETTDGLVLAASIDPPTTHNLGGPMAVLDFLWWISRRRGVTRGSTAGPAPSGS
jgi:hypothetical protein